MNTPNILLLTIDTLRADVLGCYGYHRALTPNLDRLAASGIRFEQAISGGSWTQAAFPVMLTSTHAAMYGGCLGRLAPERPSPVSSLARHGYTTGAFSTNVHLSRTTGYDRGFDTFVELNPTEKDPALRQRKGGQHLLRNPLFHALVRPTGMNLKPARLYSSAAEVTESLCAWLEEVKTPFFAWAHYMDVHWPYHLEESLSAPGEIAQAWRDLGTMYGGANFGGKTPITHAQRQHFVGLYEESLRYLDSQVGRLLDELERSGRAEDTVIIVVADHGEEFLDHGRWGHWESNLYDEILNVPLLVRLPGETEGSVIRQQVSLLDLMPTVLDLCGCPAPDGLLGSSLVPLWSQNDDAYPAQPVVSEMRRDPWHRVAVRTEAFKAIWDNKQPDKVVLFDLQADPGETQDVSERFSEEVARFRAIIDAHLRRVAETEPATAAPKPEHDEAVTLRLRALGYLD